MRRSAVGMWIHSNLSGPGAAGFIQAWSWAFGRDGRRPLAFLWAAAYIASAMVAGLIGAPPYEQVIAAVGGILVLGLTVIWAAHTDESSGGGEAVLSWWSLMFLDLLSWTAVLVALDLWQLSITAIAIDIVRALWLSTMLSDPGAPGLPVWQRFHRHTLAPVGT